MQSAEDVDDSGRHTNVRRATDDVHGSGQENGAAVHERRSQHEVNEPRSSAMSAT